MARVHAYERRLAGLHRQGPTQRVLLQGQHVLLQDRLELGHALRYVQGGRMRLRRHVGGGHPRDGRIRASHGEVPRAGQPGGMHGDQRGVGEDEADDRGPRVGAGGAPLCGEWRRRCHVEHGGVVALLQVAAQRRLKDDDGRPSAPLGLVHDAVARKHAVLAPDAIGGAVGQAGRSRKHADAVSWNQYAVVVTRLAGAGQALSETDAPRADACASKCACKHMGGPCARCA